MSGRMCIWCNMPKSVPGVTALQWHALNLFYSVLKFQWKVVQPWKYWYMFRNSCLIWYWSLFLIFQSFQKFESEKNCPEIMRFRFSLVCLSCFHLSLNSFIRNLMIKSETRFGCTLKQNSSALEMFEYGH